MGRVGVPPISYSKTLAHFYKDSILSGLCKRFFAYSAIASLQVPFR